MLLSSKKALINSSRISPAAAAHSSEIGLCRQRFQAQLCVTGSNASAVRQFTQNYEIIS
jgi:hypothetical protein